MPSARGLHSALDRMNLPFVFVTLLIVSSFARGASTSDETFVMAAAKRADGVIRWQPKSIIDGDFTCRGRKELAILGTSSKEIVIAVFARDVAKPLDVMRFSGIARNPASAILSVESLDFTIQDFEREIGTVPDGLVPSKTCIGLNMTDQMIDSAHIYWHRKHGRFESWSL